ncbi:MAG: UvrD-helicase domain-containing protein [Candidatus Zixiibacteriota bacterium]
MIEFLKDLNPPQREAASHIEGPLLILAGAGSGKTRVLTYRIAYLIRAKRVLPSKILAVTFTNKAAQEMRNRVEKLLGKIGAPVWISTFHSLCSRILRREAKALGYKTSFTIYDEDDSLSLVKKCMERLEIPTKKVSPKAVLSHISDAKNKLIDWKGYQIKVKDFFQENVSRIYELYQTKLEDATAFDFDDLIMKTVELFDRYPEVLGKYQNRFKYILVDEYQDTNHAQYVLVKQLASLNRDLCVVGDDDQSIYGWRGADLNNILDFEKDYPECKTIRLEQNYRSTQVILDAASSVVKNNLSRKGKTLWTDEKGGDKIKLVLVDDEHVEALSIVDSIKNLLDGSSVALKDFVILYRTNAQSRVLEQKLRDNGIPYVIVGGVRFYQRKEIKDVLAYLKVLVNPNDLVSWKRIINIPPRGIGDKTFAKLEEYSFENNLTFLKVLENVEKIPEISPRLGNSVKEFFRTIKEFIGKKDKLTIDKLTEYVIEKTGYLNQLLAEGTIESESRADNLKELISATQEFKQRADDSSLNAFLEEVSLLSDIDYWDHAKDAVNMMTLHSAKGLEFPVVFITGLEEGLFPLSRSMDSLKELEEERRLFYVGLTRAKKKLFLSFAHNRRRFGDMINLRSRFLDELTPENLEVEDLITTSWERKEKAFSQDQEMEFDDSLLQAGTRVLHPNFGEGKIIKKEGFGESTRLLVKFKAGFTKKLMAKYADLEIIGR